MSAQIMCYVARERGKDTFYAISVERPERSEDNAELVAGWIREGAIVEYVTKEEGVSRLFWEGDDDPKAVQP